ncbi:hypothetical protein [Streptomyces sp. NBC_00576]|uniref:hypothetical protein n=1 Tax=Streptomyces sp. NBC_00576 TaxID=2903665 RepID=UPI002E8103A9|nr:hypothetical protein [Streptomyces sp. NBC_00576]WUB70068.1 hypothetical protein OG734_08285 [Streptomyces sp. NBC_00576]
MKSEGADVLDEARCALPRRVLCFEVADTVCLCVFGRGLTLGGFPSQALLVCCLQVGLSLVFGCLAAKADLLHDLGELALERACGRVGPLAGPVVQPTADTDSQTVGGPPAHQLPPQEWIGRALSSSPRSEPCARWP